MISGSVILLLRTLSISLLATSASSPSLPKSRRLETDHWIENHPAVPPIDRLLAMPLDGPCMIGISTSFFAEWRSVNLARSFNANCREAEPAHRLATLWAKTAASFPIRRSARVAPCRDIKRLIRMAFAIHQLQPAFGIRSLTSWPIPLALITSGVSSTVLLLLHSDNQAPCV